MNMVYPNKYYHKINFAGTHFLRGVILSNNLFTIRQ